RPRVRLEDPELAAGYGVVDPFRHGAHDLDLDVARASRSLRRRQRVAGDGLPALAEVRRDVRDGGTAEHAEGIVPADVAAGLVLGGVEAVARVRRQVDAADECDAVVDDDDLLVVTVER